MADRAPAKLIRPVQVANSESEVARPVNDGSQPDARSATRSAASLMFAVSLALTLLTNLVGLYVARTLAIAEYGRLAYFSNLFLVTMLLFGFGLTGLVVMEVARARAVGRSSDLREVFYSLLTFRLVTVATLILIGTALTSLRGDELYVQVGLTAGLAVLVDFLLGVLQGLQRTRRAAAAYLIQPLTYGLLLLADAPTSSGQVIFMMQVSYAVAVGFVVLNLVRVGIGVARTLPVSWRYVRKSLPTSGQIHVIGLLQVAFEAYAIVWLGSIGRYAEVAQLGIAWTIVRLLPLTMGPLYYTAFYPRVCDLHAQGDVAGVKWHVASFFEGLAVLTLAASVLIALFPATIIGILFTDKYAQSGPLLAIMAPMVTLLTLDTLTASALTAINHRRVVIVALTARLVVFAALVALPSVWGADGSATWIAEACLMASLVGLGIQGGFYWRWSQGEIPLGRLVSFAGLSLAASALVSYGLPDVDGSSLLHAYKLFLAGLLVAGLVAWYLRPRLELQPWTRRRLSSLVLASVMTAGVLGTPAPSHAQNLDRCQGAVGTATLVIDCAPGFASPADRITMYSRRPLRADVPWSEQLNYDAAVWVFDVGTTGRASLIIDFHPFTNVLAADLYDDGDGDGQVQYALRQGVPVVLERDGRWTIRVTSDERWWTQEGKVNFNLDISIDGPVRGSFGSDFLYDRFTIMQNDGRVDYAIHVRDSDRDGRPDYEWRQDILPQEYDRIYEAHYRTSISANTQGDEHPIAGSLFWPYLSDSVRQFVKGYNESYPPIQVDWSRGKIIQVAEWVASRGNPGNYFIYSIERVLEGGGITQANFENPFAFYDLSGTNDGWPDMTIRFEVTLPQEVIGINVQDPINIVQYTWDQQHDHTWDYQVSVVGRQQISESIKFPEFAVQAIPPSMLPAWVNEQTWQSAALTAIEGLPYWTSEHIYEWSVESGGKVLPLQYMLGRRDTPPTQEFGEIPAGFRGEYAFHLNGRPILYFSPIDRKLHLWRAEGGSWNMGRDRMMRYESLDGEHITTWRLSRDGSETSVLHVLMGQAVYADHTGVYLGSSDVPPELFRTLPPTNHDEWAELKRRIEGGLPPPNLAGDDLRGAFERQGTVRQRLAGASLRDFRLHENGFRFVVDLSERVPVEASWASELEAGSYAVQYRHGEGYAVEPLKPATLNISSLVSIQDSLSTSEPIKLSVALENRGGADAKDVELEFWARRDGQEPILIGTASLEVLGGTANRAGMTWLPPDAGAWQIVARTASQELECAPLNLWIGDPEAGGMLDVLAVQGFGPGAMILAGSVLSVAVILAAGIGLASWRGRPQLRRSSTRG